MVVLKIVFIKKLLFLDENICQLVSFVGPNRCIIDFCYVKEDGDIHLPTSQNCIMTANVKLLSSGLAVVFAFIVAGLIAICLSKIRLYRLERAEFKRFVNEKKVATEMNPLYKAAKIEYKNPMCSS